MGAVVSFKTFQNKTATKQTYEKKLIAKSYSAVSTQTSKILS